VALAETDEDAPSRVIITAATNTAITKKLIEIRLSAADDMLVIV